MSISAHAIHFSGNGRLLSPLDTQQFSFSGATQLPGPDGTLLQRKSELHVTLMDAEAVRQVCGRLPSDGLLAQARALDWAMDRTGDGAVLGTDDREQAAKDYDDGCSVLPPDVRVEVGKHASAVDRWLRRHDAHWAFLFSVKAPFSGRDSMLGDRCRWAMLDACASSEGIRLLPVRAKEDPDGAFSISGCLLDVPVAVADRLLRDYEQLAGVRVEHGAKAELYCHPQLRRVR